MIKKGDKVRIWDNSYSVKVGEGSLKIFSYPGGNCNQDSPIYRVADTNLKLPASHIDENSPIYNDTIIKNFKNGDMYFIRECQLKKVDDRKRFSELEPGQAFKQTFRDEEVYFIKIDNYNALVITDNHWCCDTGKVGSVEEDVRVTPATIEELKKALKNEN